MEKDGLSSWLLCWKVTSAGADVLQGDLPEDEADVWRMAEQTDEDNLGLLLLPLKP